MDGISGKDIKDAVFSLDIAALVDVYNRCSDSESDKRSFVDNCLKTKSVALMGESTNLYDDVSKLLNFCFESASKECASKTVPGLVLADIFESTTIDRCEQIFELIEKKAPLWKSPAFFDNCRTQLLRVCNDLLRRLSRTIDTEFCGRILIFLARCLPLTEKSGLNLTSQFNSDNVTKYDAVENHSEPWPGAPGTVGGSGSVSVDEQVQTAAGTKATGNEAMEVEEGETDDSGTPIVSVNYNLYVKFWQLQQYFATPNNCYEKFGWRQFQHNANEVLNAFSSLKLDPPHSASASKKLKLDDEGAGEMDTEKSSPVHSRRPTWATDVLPMTLSEEGQRSGYFAKYLTSQKLLHLQFNDSTFRRYILVQFLILFQYLTSEVKFKDKKTHVLNEEQTKWVEETVKKCYALLAETYPHGEYFVRIVQQILNREEYWNQWKNSGCDDFTQKTDKEKMALFRKRPRAKENDQSLDLGNPTLSQLWNVCHDNFEACRSKERKFIPELENFLEEPLEQMDPEAGIEEQYKLINDENFQWRALRLLSMKSQQFFQPSGQVTSINKFLQAAFDNVANTIPKFKDRKKGTDLKNGQSSSDQNGDGASPQQEQEFVRTDTNAEEEAEFQAQNFGGPGEQMVTQEQIDSLAILIGSDWVKLATDLDMPDDSIEALKKKQVASEACAVVLTQWCDSEGAHATVRSLRNALLKAELFNEDVSAVLTTPIAISASIVGSSDTAKQDWKAWEEAAKRPVRIVSTERHKSNNEDGGEKRETTPVLDE